MRNILSMIGLVLLLVPALVVAQTPPPPDDSDPDICTDDPEVLAILALDPINASYMNEIKKRLNRFINLADGETASVNDFGTYLQNVTFAAAAMSTLLDTDRRLVETERNLKDRTLCLNIDLLILEAHVENVRCEMKEAYEAIEGSAILILTEALRFLDDRFKELTQGATDLSYIDNTWIFVLGYEQFDEEVHELELCPFHTDYLPPTAAGWGCDEEVLANYASDFISIELQRDAFITMIQKRDQFLTSIGFIPATIQKIAALLGRPPPLTPLVLEVLQLRHISYDLAATDRKALPLCTRIG